MSGFLGYLNEKYRQHKNLSSGDEWLDAKVAKRSYSDALSLARRLHPLRSEERLVASAKDLAVVPDNEYALHEMCCNACQLHDLVDDLAYHAGWSKDPDRLSIHCQFCQFLRKCHQNFGKNCDMINIFPRGSIKDLQICFSGLLCEGNHVQLYSTASDTHASPFRHAKDVCEDAGSEASVAVMKDWINDCQVNHQHVPSKHGCRPTRLIKLSKTQEDVAKLCSPSISVKFAALTYRWGSDRQCETTRENVRGRFEGLVTSEFPQTLQDAVHIAGKLGLEYIWIDRICIVQDDNEDWAKEASLMADIYANAYVVLSATATEDCKEGFLQTRLKPLHLQYTHWGEREIRARKVETHNCARSKPKETYTLFYRGWCMQERFLASRIIHFLPDEMLFECEFGRECECGAAREETILDPNKKGFQIFTRLRAAPKMTQGFGLDWLEIVQDYTNMDLTYGGDSLPALSGLAACMEHLKPGKYIAGLWEHDIAFQLGWSVVPRSSTRRWKYPEDIDMVGPTFSWSSHVRTVEVYRPLSGEEEICTLESFDVHLATPNPYGQVLHASLCLSGGMVNGGDLASWIKKLKPGGHTECVHFDSGVEYNASSLFTHSDEYRRMRRTIKGKNVKCFGLYSYESWKGHVVDGLLLKPVGTTKGVYVRIGIFRELEKTWFYDNAWSCTITIL